MKTLYNYINENKIDKNLKQIIDKYDCDYSDLLDAASEILTLNDLKLLDEYVFDLDFGFDLKSINYSSSSEINKALSEYYLFLKDKLKIDNNKLLEKIIDDFCSCLSDNVLKKICQQIQKNNK